MNSTNNVLYSSIAYALSQLPPKYFKKIPFQLLKNFLPKANNKELSFYLKEEHIKKIKTITLNMIEDEIAKVLRCKAEVLHLFHHNYPSSIKEIYDPPPVLYIKGKICFKNESISIVGPRRPSLYGKNATEYFLNELANYNINTVSGMAPGIDSLVHKLSLINKLHTNAVLGTGIDICYPKSVKEIYNEIAQNACIISEFPMGTPPRKYHFPRRNRIIAALSPATLVIEAKAKSGSLITAGFARDFGKEVFAIPGSIFNYNSKGTNALISEGAKPCLDIETIITERIYSELTLRVEEKSSQFQASKKEKDIVENNMLKDLLNFLVKPMHLENIIDFCMKRHYTFSYTMLTTLEQKGYIRVTPEQMIIRTAQWQKIL